MEQLVVIILAYLFGGIPTAYLAARVQSGIDLRRHGTGNVGASNYIRQIGLRSGLAVGLFDGFVKGTLPIVLAKLFGLSLGYQAALGLATVVGHNWSPYIRFTGGRGVATAMGAYVGFGLWQQLLMGSVVVGVVGWLLLRNLALWMIIGMTATIPLSIWLRQPREATWLLTGLLLLVLIKRLTSNWEKPMANSGHVRLFLYRLAYDRDVARRDAWLSKRAENTD